MYESFFFDNKLDWAPTVDNVWKGSLQTLHFDIQIKNPRWLPSEEKV